MTVAIANSPRPLSQLMERFPDLRKHETDEGVLVARCPTPHEGDLEGSFLAREHDTGWSIEPCDMGCLPSEIWVASSVGRRAPGDDDDAKPQPKEKNRFAAAYRRFTADELAADPAPPQFILRPYIPAERVSVLSASGGSGKTTLTALLAASRAMGRRMFDQVVPREGETAILTTEDRFEDYQAKFAALREHLGTEYDRTAVAERVHIFDMSGLPVRLVLAERGEQFRPSPEVDELADALKRLAPRADHVIIETISRVTGGVETNASLSMLIAAGERLSVLAKVAVTFVGHVGQSAGASGRADQYASRGGTSLVDNARSAMVLTALTGKNAEEYASGLEISDEDLQHTLVWTAPKVNRAAPVEPRLLRRLSTRFGPVFVDANYSPAPGATPASTTRPAGKRGRGRPSERTYEELRAAIVDVATKKGPISGNGVFHYLKGAKTLFNGAVLDLLKEGLLRRDKEGRLVVPNSGSKLQTIQNQLPGTTGSEFLSPPSLEGGRERGNSVPGGGSLISEPANSEPAKSKEVF